MKISHRFRVAAQLLLVFTSTGAIAYPNVNIHNDTLYKIEGKVEYLGCPSDNFSIDPGSSSIKKEIVPTVWKASSRGAFQWCLVTKIEGTIVGDPPKLTNVDPSLIGGTKEVTPYESSGTGYAEFHIRPYGNKYRIFSVAEYEAATDTDLDKSPGFHLRNHTQWAINYSLSQVGCLYHGVIPPGDGESIRDKDGNPRLTKPALRTINTGAVWFTLSAHIQPDQKDAYGDWDCALPAIEFTAEVGIAVLTGGSFGSVKAFTTNGLKVGAKTAAQVGIKQGIKSGVKAGVTAVSKRLIWNATERTFYSIAKTAVKRAVEGQVIGAGIKLAVAGLAEDEELVSIDDEQAFAALQAMLENTKVSLPGQYAGYDWPFRCPEMPTYDIYGGPIVSQDKDGNILFENQDFFIQKANDCGNDFMAGAPKSGASYEEDRVPGGNKFAAPDDRVFIDIDCAPDGVFSYIAGNSDDGTKGALVYRFFDGVSLLASYTKIGGTNCDTNDDHVAAFIVPEKSNVTHVSISNLSNDSLMIDEISIDRLRGVCLEDNRINAQGCLHEFGASGILKATNAESWGRWTDINRKIDIRWSDRKEWIEAGLQHPDFPVKYGREGGGGYCIRKNGVVPSEWKGRSMASDRCFPGIKFEIVSGEAFPYTPWDLGLDWGAEVAEIEAPYGSKSFADNGDFTSAESMQACGGYAKAKGYRYFSWYEVGDYGGSRCKVFQRAGFQKSSREVSLRHFEIKGP